MLRRLTLALALACSLGSATTAYAATAFVWPDALEPSTATGAVTSREFVLATYSDPALLTFQQPIAPTVNADALFAMAPTPDTCSLSAAATCAGFTFWYDGATQWYGVVHNGACPAEVPSDLRPPAPASLPAAVRTTVLIAEMTNTFGTRMCVGIRVDVTASDLLISVDGRNISDSNQGSTLARLFSMTLTNETTMSGKIFPDNPASPVSQVLHGLLTIANVTTSDTAQETVGGLTGIRVTGLVPSRVAYGTSITLHATVYRGTSPSSGEAVAAASADYPTFTGPTLFLSDTSPQTDAYGEVAVHQTMTASGKVALIGARLENLTANPAVVSSTTVTTLVGPITVFAGKGKVSALKVKATRGGKFTVSLSVSATPGLTITVKIGRVLFGAKTPPSGKASFSRKGLKLARGAVVSVTTSAFRVQPTTVKTRKLR